LVCDACNQGGISCSAEGQDRRMWVITDGFPLCMLKGLELCSIDLQKILRESRLYAGEKGKPGSCSACSLNALCWGPREDCLRLRGGREFKPQKGSPAELLKGLKENGRPGACGSDSHGAGVSRGSA